MKKYFKLNHPTGYVLYYGDKKKVEKAEQLGVIYDEALADDILSFLEEYSITENGDTEVYYGNVQDEPVEDLVDELKRGLTFDAKAGDFSDDEWHR